MALIEDVRKALRVKGSGLDDEVSDLLEASKKDLRITGIVNIEETDPLIKRAIMLYCKANFGLSNPDSEKFQASYDTLKNHMAISLDYIVEVVESV